LRSVIFERKDVAIAPYSGKQVTLTQPVDTYKFDSYVCALLKMAQLSRLIYCDAAILRAALISPEFAQASTMNNRPVNDLVTRLDAQYKKDRYTKSAAPNSIEGRPPQSYIGVYGKSSQTTVPFARYIATPSDVTFMFIKGSMLKCSIFRPDDVVLVFKGSSTVKNFKHDLYAGVKGYVDISTVFPEIPVMDGRTNGVPIGFLKPLKKAFHLVYASLAEYKPRRLFITGHSLGGAYATLAAFILGSKKPAGIESIHLVSFGAPTILGDGARNTFNAILDSGYMTLDRVVSHFSKYVDPISMVPSGFSHPGFQPLKTEFYPEMKTGRAYHIGKIKKVYTGQDGGFMGFGKEKAAYSVATKTHVPNKVMVPVTTRLWVTFPHADYMGMTFAGGQRLYGMKNPGFKNHTFIAEFSGAGLVFKYIDAKPGDVPLEDAKVGDPTLASVGENIGDPTSVQTNSNSESVDGENPVAVQKPVVNTMPPSVEVSKAVLAKPNVKRSIFAPFTIRKRRVGRKHTRKLRR